MAFSLLILYGQIMLAAPASAEAYDGGLSPTIFGLRADLNGDDAVTGRDDSNNFYGDTDIIDGQLDCDGWDNNGTNGNDASDTGDEGPAGDGVIDGADDCTLIGVDGTPNGTEISVLNGSFVARDNVAIADGTPLPTVFNDGAPTNTDIGDSDFAWSTIDGRVDANGDETIDGDDCHLGLIGQTVDAGLNDPHDGADVLASDGSGTNQCTGLDEVSAVDDDGLVDLNSDGNITLAADTCNTGCFLGHNLKEGVVQTTSSPATTLPTNSPFTGGFGPTIYNLGADLNGDASVTGRDDANAFYGDTHIIDGLLDCDAWTTENDGTAGNGQISTDDDCTLIGYDGTAAGVEITVVNGLFALADGLPILNGTPLPTVFNAGDPDNPDIGDSDFAWSTITGRVDSSGDETIDGEDCHLGLIGETVDAGLGNPHDGADVLASDGTGTNQCTGLDEEAAAADDGLVDLDSDGNITSADSCTNGCFFTHNVLEGVVQTVPQISINDVSVAENAGTATFTVTLSSSSQSIVTVNYATANGTATAGSDYTAASGTVTFLPGDTSESVSVTITNDTTDEPDETFFVNLSSPVNAPIDDAQGVGTINDDDATPTIAINNVTVAENAGTATFAVTLSNPSSSTITVAYATANNTATAGSDYTAASGTVTFVASDVSENISVAITNDTADEVNETFFVNLSSPTNATIADNQGVGTITDDDDPVPPPPPPTDTPGIVRDNTWFLNNDFDGDSDVAPFLYGRAGDIPISGDWDGDGSTTPGIIRGNVWYLNNDTDGDADVVPFAYGRAGDFPIVGDWDGDGDDTPGIVRGNAWYLNDDFDGDADVIPFAYGSSTDFPVTGDWDGDGDTTPGIVRGNVWYLNHDFDGDADIQPFAYGRSTDFPITGDWDGDDSSSPGIVRENAWYLNNDFDGDADITPFLYGRSTDFPVTGNWDG